jgi:hypothetical protein
MLCWLGAVIPAAGSLCSTVLIHSASAQVAAARGYPKLLQKDLATGIEIVLDRAGQVNPLQAAGAQLSIMTPQAPCRDRSGFYSDCGTILWSSSGSVL